MARRPRIEQLVIRGAGRAIRAQNHAYLRALLPGLRSLRIRPMDLVRRIRTPGAQARALRFLGPDAYLEDGDGVIYEMVRLAHGRLRDFKAFVRQRPNGFRTLGANLQELTKRGWLEVKYGSTVDMTRRNGEYARCREGGNPVELLATYGVNSRRLIERLVQLELRAIGAQVRGDICEGTRCLAEHREWFALNRGRRLRDTRRILRAVVEGFPGGVYRRRRWV